MLFETKPQLKIGSILERIGKYRYKESAKKSGIIRKINCLKRLPEKSKPFPLFLKKVYKETGISNIEVIWLAKDNPRTKAETINSL